jgi:hypothetical protein
MTRAVSELLKKALALPAEARAALSDHRQKTSRGSMYKVFSASLLIPILLFSQTQQPVSPWETLKVFAGHWQGTNQGKPGHGTVERRYEFLFGSTFLEETNTSTYPPQEQNPKGEVHHHMAIFSYDRQRKKIVFRQFHQEGFVNQYVLDSAAPDGKKLVFVSEAIENIAPGWRARETYTIASKDEIIERFELAAPGKDFELYTENRLRRVMEKP